MFDLRKKALIMLGGKKKPQMKSLPRKINFHVSKNEDNDKKTTDEKKNRRKKGNEEEKVKRRRGRGENNRMVPRLSK